MSDREVLVAIYKLLAALAERVTGDSPAVEVATSSGEAVTVDGCGDGVRWIRKTDQDPGR